MKKIRLVTIGKIKVGIGQPPVIVSEMSGNHNCSLERALEIVEAAASCGVGALKLQTYTAETMTLNVKRKEFFIHDSKSLWQGESLYQLYQKAYTPWEWHKPIFERCKKLGIIGFSTVFDATAVDFLESLDVPCYKIASFENIDIPLIRKAASTKKPIIISTGMATGKEIDEAVSTACRAGAKDIILLKCTSSYPAQPENSNILTIPDMQRRFACNVGLSDHTLGIGVAVASIALGACMIEKHFTLSRKDGGVDAAFSLEPDELKALVSETRRAWSSLGKVRYGVTLAEKKSFIFRRSLYAAEDIKKGEIITKDKIRVIRPGLGLAPRYYDTIIGKKTRINIKKGTPLNWKML